MATVTIGPPRERRPYTKSATVEAGTAWAAANDAKAAHGFMALTAGSLVCRLRDDSETVTIPVKKGEDRDWCVSEIGAATTVKIVLLWGDSYR